MARTSVPFFWLILAILASFLGMVLSGYHVKTRFDRSVDRDREATDTDLRIHDRKGILTYTDYETRFIAYKDANLHACYLERIVNDPFEGRNIWKWSLPRQRTLYVSDESLMKLEVWRLAGGRIVEFCQGLPMTLLQQTRPVPGSTEDPFFNEIPKDENDIVQRRVTDVILTPLLARAKRQILLENRVTSSNSRIQDRPRRQVTHRGRFRGQTQSQYLDFSPEGDQGGKAEAEATHESSHAVVSGNRGMGQAQSMSGNGDGCEGCPGYSGSNRIEGVPGTVQMEQGRLITGGGERYVEGTGGTAGTAGTLGFPSGPGSFSSGVQSVPGTYPANLVHPGDGSVSYSGGVRPSGGDDVLYPVTVRGGGGGPYPGVVQPINGHYIEGDRMTGGPVYPGDIRPTGEPGTAGPGPYPGTPGGATIYPGSVESSGVSRTAGPGSYPGGPGTYPGISESGGVSGISGPGSYNVVPGVTVPVTYSGAAGGQPTGSHGLYSGGTIQSGRHFGTEQGSGVVPGDVGSRGPVVYTDGASGTRVYTGDGIVGTGMTGGIRNGIGGPKETESGMRGTYPSTVDTAVYPGNRQTGGLVPVGTNGRPLGSDVGVYPSGTGSREPIVYHEGGRTILPGVGSDGLLYAGGPGTYPGVPVGSPGAGVQSRQSVLSPSGVYPVQPIGGSYGGETRQNGGSFDGAGGEREVRPIGSYPAGAYPSGTSGPVLYPGGTVVSGRAPAQQPPGARSQDGGYVSVGAAGLGGAEVYYPGTARGGAPPGHPAGGQLAVTGGSYPATSDGRISGQYSLAERDDGRHQFPSGGDVSTGRYPAGVAMQRGQGSSSGTEQYPTGVIVGQYPTGGIGRYPASSTITTGGQGINAGRIAENIGIGVGSIRGDGTSSGQYAGRIVDGGAYPGGGAGGPIAAPLYLQPKSEADRGYEQSVSRGGIIADGSESQALSSVKQVNSGTQASASAQGKYGQGTAQSQVTGTYSGSGSFSAQAGTSDANKSAQTQVNGDKKGATSSSQGTGGYGTSQSKVQLNSDTGATSTGAQSSGWNHGTSSQVQASSKGGMADAQANGEGSTSSQAQIGFQPYLKRNEKLEKQSKPFRGGGTASAQSGTYKGQSQSQLHGEFQYGITYSGAAQAGSGSGAAASRKPFNFTNTDTELFKTFEPFEPLEPDVTTTIAGPTDIETEPTILPPLETDYDDDGHADGDQPGLQTSSSRKTVVASPTVSKTIERDDDEPPLPPSPSSSSHITHISTQPRVNADDQIYDTAGNDEYEDEYEDEDYDSSPSTLSRQTGPEVSGVPRDKDVGVSVDVERSSQSSQTIQVQDVGGRNYGTRRTQDSSAGLNEGDVLQPGESLPGYTIPPGFRGRVTSVSGDGTTIEADGQSQLQRDDLVSASRNETRENKIAGKSIVSEARSLRGKHDPGSRYKARTVDRRYSKVKPTRLRSMLSGNARSISSDPFVKPNYYTVTNSIAGKMDDSKNPPRKYEHRYYTKSSTCGYFTFSCNIVYGSNGRTKICKPKLPTNPDGTPMRC